jgi:hypothetical protein
MTARNEYGKAWVPWTAFYEMIATPDPKRRDILGVLVNLHRELDDRIVLTGSLQEVVAAEWSEPMHVPSRSFSHLEAELLACVHGGGTGTLLDEEAFTFAEWRRNKRADYAKQAKKFAEAYRSDEAFAHAITRALETAQPPAVFETCDDVAAQLIELFAHHHRDEGLRLAKSTPDKYLATWTFALLFRIAQFAQTVPTQDRARGPFGGYASLLKSHENDMTDATIAALGARCGFVITQDRGLRERITFLHNRGACRLQAVEFSDIEANWHEPGV